jgi:hypothetical protein
MKQTVVLLTLAGVPMAALAAPAGAMLHDFVGSDGDSLGGKLLLDWCGVLYGTTVYGGDYGYGTVDKLTPPAAGSTHWTTTVLHSFAGQHMDGSSPAW